MDFFEAQARAKKRTTRLLALFALAVAGTIGAAYFAAILILHYSGANQERRALYGDYDPRATSLGGLRHKVAGRRGNAGVYRWKVQTKLY